MSKIINTNKDLLTTSSNFSNTTGFGLVTFVVEFLFSALFFMDCFSVLFPKNLLDIQSALVTKFKNLQ